VKTVDTSVVVAAFATWHEAHEAARRILDEAPRIPGHVALEAYSVLTRLPAPHRAPAGQVSRFLEAAFREPWLTLPSQDLAPLIDRLVDLRITGGGIYDALIGATALRAGATLVTRDRRALLVYERLGVDVLFVG
jgi:predicted nucleic acid-binding protein